MNFDHIIFIASTDCFSAKLLGERFADNLDGIKNIARAATLELMNGDADYYYDADFREERISKTKNDFFQKLSTLSDSISGRFAELDSIASQRTLSQSANSIQLIKSVSARIYWLNTDDFQIEISDELIEAVIQAQLVEVPLDTETDLACEEIHERWEYSSFEWDKYIKNIMKEVPGAICAIFNDLYNSPLSLSYLNVWSERLSRKHFMTLIKAIEDEAFLEMEKIDKGYAELVRPIMKQFYE
ncbi:hypothetical protein A1354_27750 [Pseudomonas asplenii]|nr:hypothetical protein [Pseudomonas asplenii]PNG41869.1 hypothetical protein A1354_27750 [Pseudomonas asplenii]